MNTYNTKKKIGTAYVHKTSVRELCIVVKYMFET